MTIRRDGDQHRGLLGRLRHLGRKFWIPFLVACVVVIFLERGFEYLLESGHSPGEVTNSILVLSGLYRKLVAAPRNPIPHYTAIVEIDPDKDKHVPSLNELCKQRGMMADLLPKIASALPSVIVIDKFYKAADCPNNEKLSAAILQVCETIPILIGRRAEYDNDKDIGPFLVPTLNLGTERCSQFREFVVNLDFDTRLLPLGWKVFPTKQDAEKKNNLEWRETLALVSARAYDENLLVHHPRLEGFIKRWQHPYISFLKEDDFPVIPAARILADSDSYSDGEIRGALHQTLTAELRKKLPGKIVLIGEIAPDSDTHHTVVGPLPGVYLQANYVEALLDARYFQPVPILDYVFSFLILVILEFILVVYHGEWLKMGLLIAALFLSAVAFLYLVIMHFGWYVNPVLVSGLAVVIKVLQPLLGRAEIAATKQRETNGGH